MNATQRAQMSQAPFLDLYELGHRWRCHRATAYRRMKRFGIKAVKLSQRSVLFALKDVLRVEKDCM
jgi:hypothetical protein